MYRLLKVSIVNSYILYTTTLRQLGQQPQSHLQFCREFILQLVAHRLQLPLPSRFGPHVDLSLERLRPVTHFSEESERRWECRVYCAVLLVGVIPHHIFVLPALIGHIATSPPRTLFQAISREGELSAIETRPEAEHMHPFTLSLSLSLSIYIYIYIYYI